ncbi:unnamed protein product, partial [Heterotrigona itama]
VPTISEPLNTRIDLAAFFARITLNCPPHGHLENLSLKTPCTRLIASTFQDT